MLFLKMLISLHYNMNIYSTGRTGWLEEEKAAIEKHLKTFSDTFTAPRQADCVKCIELSGSVLENRNWLEVKNYVHNTNKSQKKKAAKMYVV